MEYLKRIRAKLGSDKFIYPGARIIIENEAGEILLIRRTDSDRWGLIAGGLEEGESISECIIREAREETGLELLEVEGIGLSTRPEAETVSYPNGDVVQYFSVVFYCKNWRGELLDRSAEAKEMRFFAWDKLPDLPENERPSLEWLRHYKEEGQFFLD
jgi:ADP-ribose pyrophosphatase YjhB (NUDIX family)